MGKQILFRIEISSSTGGFAQASSFITKLTKGMSITPEEVEGISNIIYDGNNTPKSIGEYTHANTNNFKSIRKPENLLAGIQGYEIGFCLVVAEDQLEDVVDIQYDFLIKNCYKDLTITTLLYGNTSFYFKISHYLYDISLQNEKIYNSIFYLEENKLKRLQKENVEHIADFVPLQYIDTNNNNLSRPLGELVSSEVLKQKLLSNAKTTETSLSPTLLGCFQQLKSSRKLLKKMECPDKFLDRIRTGAVLEFMLFSYSLKSCIGTGESGKNANEIIEGHYRKIRECVVGCQQLIENAIFHSEAHSGTVSIRFHSRNSDYLKKKYGDCIEEIPHLEIVITDYDGTNSNGNIAENFICKISNPQLKNKFKNLWPIDFITSEYADAVHKEEIESAFENYYSYPQNLGRHFGLKIFQNSIEKNQAIFTFYSHSNHRRQDGEEYHMTSKDISIPCMPGTGFGIIFPLLETQRSITMKEIGIEQKSVFSQKQSYYNAQYSCEDYALKPNEEICKTQEEKDNIIRELVQELKIERFNADGKTRIIYICARDFTEEMGEYLCKAMLISGYLHELSDFVLYECSQEFVDVFQKTMSAYFRIKDMSFAFRNKEFAIVLYTKAPIESTYIIPGKFEETLMANKKANYAGGDFSNLEWLLSDKISVEDEEYRELPPYDVLHKVNQNAENSIQKRTIFESYALQILETNIQDKSYGCKLNDTHMRLGSTIHISCFYEAELLFSNRLFISRFAYLLAQDIADSNEFIKEKEITLYSYALYSELLIVELMSILSELYPDKDLDYAILEREAEHREFSHADRIRYSLDFETPEERSEHFSTRKIICIVPINSTLKTHEKLISLFGECNQVSMENKVILNYAIILVGSKEKNSYWHIDEDNRTFLEVTLNIRPIPRYFISVKVDYHEALGCSMCFPDNPLDEIPLIEVNASSTVPNQAFGLQNVSGVSKEKCDYTFIKKEEEELSVLKNSQIYSHIQRGENHFLYYFKTDRLFVENKADIIKWLEKLSSNITFKDEEYHILFSPSHFSNAGFLEYINKIVFKGAALIIRADVDKEYRGNMCSKYSNISSLIELLSRSANEKYTLKIYYIDDSIITGRTFFRSKSLISSITEQYINENTNIEIHIFEKIFVLLDRNSPQSRMQYIECWDNKKTLKQLDDHFCAYRTLRISSMRSHGDSCILCQLKREADFLYQTSSTRKMTEYWKKESGKFKKQYLRDKQGEEKIVKATDKDKAFRRMFCSHILASYINEKHHGNSKEKAVHCILQLLTEDYLNRKNENGQNEAFEYFLSYLKVMSRPFIVFNKAVKEAVFDIMLVFTETLWGIQSVDNIISKTKNKKYWNQNKVLFQNIGTNMIRNEFTALQKKDLLLLLMKQLTELKSNYFIRSENIIKLTKFIEDYSESVKAEIYEQYLRQAKKITGINSDTSKSAWLEHTLYTIRNDESITDKTMGLPMGIYGRLVLENTRAYSDGVEKLCRAISFEDNVLQFLCKDRWYYTEYMVYTEFGDAIAQSEDISDTEIKEFLEQSRCGKDVLLADMQKNWLEKRSPRDVFNVKYNKIKKNYEKIEKQTWIEPLKSILNTELQKAHYRDFRKILQDCQWLTENELTVDGAISLAAAMEIQRLGNEASNDRYKKEAGNDIEEECFRIACLMEKVLHAKEVRLLLEIPLECDLWEDNVKERYNELAVNYMGAERAESILYTSDKSKEYLVIADSNSREYSIESAKLEIAERFKQYQSMHSDSGYYIDTDNKYLIWEISSHIGMHTLIAYIDFYNLNLPDDWQLLRNVMSMNYLFGHSIFSKRAMNYLYEIIMADKDRLVYNQDKAHSHTDFTVRKRQLADVKKGEEREQGHFRSYLLTLLSDLQVSNVYRKSLKKDFYCRNLNVHPVKRSDTFEIFSGRFSVITVEQEINSESFQYLKINIITDTVIMEDEQQIQESDYFLCYDSADAENDIIMLIYALIMNAAAPDRGLRERLETTPDDIREINVYITKTLEGNLRISNKCSEKGTTADKTNNELNYPPAKGKGISLWSMSRYIKSMISSIIGDMLKKTESQISVMSEEEKKKALAHLKMDIDTLMEKDCRIMARIKVHEDADYFCIDVPVFSSKYEKYLWR